jgi:hypothetical protein
VAFCRYIRKSFLPEAAVSVCPVFHAGIIADYILLRKMRICNTDFLKYYLSLSSFRHHAPDLTRSCFRLRGKAEKRTQARKNRHLPKAGAGSCIFQALRCGLVHTAHVRGSRSGRSGLLGQVGHEGLGGQDHVPEQVMDFLCAVNR